MIKDPLAPYMSNRRLKLTVYGSDKCNQRCFYCYQDHQGRHLTDETRDGLIALMEVRAPELWALELGWFGGEPLLGAENLKAVQKRAHDLSELHGFRLMSGMTTNATLLEPHLDDLLAMGLTSYQITLDGPRELHDRTRVDAAGTPTFDRIWAALLAMKASPQAFSTRIRLHYRPDLWMTMSGLINEIDSTFLTDARFSLMLYPLQRWGGPRAKEVPLASKEDCAEIERALKSGVHPDHIARVSGANDPKEGKAGSCGCDVCYAAQANAFTISPTGQIGKCTIMVGGKNKIGRLNRDGTIELDQELHGRWIQGLVTKDAKALACPARYV